MDCFQLPDYCHYVMLPGLVFLVGLAHNPQSCTSTVFRTHGRSSNSECDSKSLYPLRAYIHAYALLKILTFGTFLVSINS
jgi:hypothetical protein